MARKKKQKIEESQAAESQSSNASAEQPAPSESAPVAEEKLVEEKKPKKKAEKKAEPKQEVKQELHMSLEDACRRFIVGYKEHWYPSIERYAKTQGYNGKASQEECRRLLQAWGAKLK